MRTSKPIATISYNTEEYLVSRLQELVRNKKICDYMYIKHFKEEDETKDHIHLWIKPNTLIDTMDIQDFQIYLLNILGHVDYTKSNHQFCLL